MGRINPWVWPAGWLVEKGIETYQSRSSDNEGSGAVREEEIERVQQLIQSGREQGLSEISIKISSSLSKKLSSNGGAAIDGIPMNVAFDIASDSGGDYVMHVKYLPKTTMDKFLDLKSLYDQEILTDEEFVQAKSELLKQL